MHPEKGKQAQENNIIKNQERKIAELTAELKKYKKPKKEKKPRKPISPEKIKQLFLFSCITIFIVGILYLLVYLLEWQNVYTYEGTIINKVFKVNTRSITTVINGGKKNNIAYISSDTTNYNIKIAFTDKDNDIRQIEFSTSKDNDWNSVSLAKANNYYDKLPFPENYLHMSLFVGKAKPYVGCKVRVYELRGTILNSNTLRGFVANVSMCKPQNAKKATK
ncbi:MAG: hypothetical protein COU51_00510 [Parcubacteria group bacterium CG10_big_fil_rev_8_21_14_0_10_36_14]|nr:MAG: hypothetical protein COU51_00510 [Parcubacteria group bacterium CG10_big_fil_rev_8_21_14_0_10_36_14]